MPFVEHDIYSSSAGTELYNYWNPFVTKFDSQSFYNFEQDNQPLYDLEERTFELWGKATGYATSSLFGMPLVVSGAIPDVAGGDTMNRNVFTNLQDALDALPNVIRTPTLIEVADSGLLGGISLKNVDIVEGGILEIVNRGFAKIYSGGGLSQGGGNGVATSAVGQCNTNINTKNAGLMTLITSLDLSATISETSAISVSENVSSLFIDGYTRAFTQLIGHTSSKMRTDKVSCCFVDPASVSPGLTTPTSQFVTGGNPVAYNNTFFMTNYEAAGMNATGQMVDATVEFQDVSSVRGAPIATGAQPEPNGANDYLVRSKIQAGDDNRQITGMVYANSVSSIEIKNCNGPLYIRGFCVDSVSGGTAAQYGAGAGWHADIGIEVTNSNPVIENCSVMRAKTAGAKFINSDVTLKRGFFSYRNYQIPAPGTARGGQTTAGIHAINSRIDLQIDPVYASGSDYAFNTQHHDYGLILENSVLTGGQAAPFDYFNGTDLAFSYNKTGIKAINSTIELSGTLDVYNNQTGLDLVNTTLSTDRLTVENNQLAGLKAESSVVKYGNRQVRELYGSDQNGFRLAQTLFNRNGVHLDLKKNSTFTYSNDASTLDIPNKYGALRFHDSHGISNYVADITASASLPAISIKNSSADLLHSRIICSGISLAGPAVIGAAVKAEDSAEVNFLGTINNATIVQGNGGVSPGVLAIAADNSSKISFRGPTLVADFYSDIAANRNSTIEFTPHRDSNSIVDVSGFNLGNKTENHTSVELHNTGGVCLAATEGSRILMEDLGSPLDTIYKEAGSNGGGVGRYGGASSTFVDPDYLVVNTSAFTKGGSMQFYPNPPLSDYLSTTNVTTTNLLGSQGLLPDTEAGDKMTAATQGQTPYNYYLTNYFSDVTAPPNDVTTFINNKLSVGGFCVKIFSNSTANVNNVNFHCGWTNADGSYFDSSATDKGCNQLRIWNIGGNSNLYAAHTSVSAIQPHYCSGYHGPRAVFLSGAATEAGSGVFDQGADMTDSQIAYAAGFPSRKTNEEVNIREAVGTPDTSSLSILDWYGFGIGPVKAGLFSREITSIQESLTGSGGTFGKLQAENLGPFRLFFDVDPCMRFVGYVSGAPAGNASFGVGDSKPYQHLAQGYSLSGPAGVAYNYGDVSSLFPKLCQPTGHMNAANTTNPPGQRAAWNLQASGYYYGSAMLQEHDPGSHVYLDENSANIFANAKNCSMPAFSGRAAPRVSIYRSTTIPWGGIGYAGHDATDTAGTFPYALGTIRGLQFWDPRRLV